jgi:hypothetical protein
VYVTAEGSMGGVESSNMSIELIQSSLNRRSA